MCAMRMPKGKRLYTQSHQERNPLTGESHNLISSNCYVTAEVTTNTVTDKRITRVSAPPGGRSSVNFPAMATGQVMNPREVPLEDFDRESSSWDGITHTSVLSETLLHKVGQKKKDLTGKIGNVPERNYNHRRADAQFDGMPAGVLSDDYIHKFNHSEAYNEQTGIASQTRHRGSSLNGSPVISTSLLMSTGMTGSPKFQGTKNAAAKQDRQSTRGSLFFTGDDILGSDAPTATQAHYRDQRGSYTDTIDTLYTHGVHAVGGHSGADNSGPRRRASSITVREPLPEAVSDDFLPVYYRMNNAINYDSNPNLNQPTNKRVSMNAFASKSNMNAGNCITGRPSTKVTNPPGGSSTFKLI